MPAQDTGSNKEGPIPSGRGTRDHTSRRLLKSKCGQFVPLMTLSELRHGAVSVCEQHGMLTLSHLRQVTRPCDLMGSLPCTLAPAEPLLCPLWVQSQCAKRGGRASGWGRELIWLDGPRVPCPLLCPTLRAFFTHLRTPLLYLDVIFSFFHSFLFFLFSFLS